MIVFLIWIYFSAVILLWGVEFTASVQQDAARHSGSWSTSAMSNRLAAERSPYLLQHADNPVDWYPWGQEAFDRARELDRPIFLSIGYSTCHWCHVMAHESFESQAIAEILNRDFISIKVDREERPDVDRVYMTFVQATTGSGGWPMSVWLTPDLKPFYGGTYFPPDARWGRPGFPEILREIVRVWQQERAKVQLSAENLTEQIKGLRSVSPGGEVPDADALKEGVAQFAQTFDQARGGFGERAEVSAAERAAVPACAKPRAQATTRRRSWWRRRCSRWRSAACATTWAADFIAIRSMPTGACRTSRRCFTTRRRSRLPASRRISWRPTGFSPRSRKTRSNT